MKFSIFAETKDQVIKGAAKNNIIGNASIPPWIPDNTDNSIKGMDAIEIKIAKGFLNLCCFIFHSLINKKTQQKSGFL